MSLGRRCKRLKKNYYMVESFLSVRYLSHRYRVQWASGILILKLNKNDIYGLLGSDGAEKSTTMNIMCWVLKQTEGGDIKEDGTSKNSVEEKNENVSFVVKTGVCEITMLGAKFNVTVYVDEHVTTTTLVEGQFLSLAKCT